MTPYPVKSRLKHFCLFLFLLSAGRTAVGQLYADFSMDQQGGCSPLVISFTNRTTGASPGALYTWDFGNGNTSALVQGAAVYTGEQTYTVTLTVVDGANQSMSSKQVTVYKPPIVDFAVNASKICLESPAVFTANANGQGAGIASYAWDFGDGSTAETGSNVQQHQYSTVQIPTVSLTVTNSFGCHATLTKKNIISIIPALTSAFTADKTVLCLVSDAVQMTNNSTGPGVLDYLWDFADGTTSTALNPGHIFNKKGFYSVSLRVHSSEGCTETSTQSNPLNVASYSVSFTVPTPICAGATAVFNSTSTPAPDNSSWQLDGVNQPYYFNYFYAVFPVAGTHTITLNNVFGTCPQTASQQISVKALPVPGAFTSKIDGVCGSPVPVEFKDQTAGAVQWQWNFNYFNYQYGGNYVQGGSSVQAPTFTYNADGTYFVDLLVTNADGCSASTGQNVTILHPQVGVIFGASVLSSCTSLVTDTYSTSSGDAVVKANWNFGDGGTSTSLQPTHTFKNDGSGFQVTLSYTTANGCTGSLSFLQQTPGPSQPVVQVVTNPSNPATCLTPITASFSISTGVPLSTINWTMGDGSTSTDPAPTHTYTNMGTYVATLTYTTEAGCKGTAFSDPIVIDPKVKATFSENPNPVCGNTPVKFVLSSPTPDNFVYNWSFGDGGFGYGANPTYQYNSPGNYIVTLYVRNRGGCDTTLTQPITVKPPIPRIIEHTNTCDGDRGAVTFTQASIEANTVTWNFGDGSTLTTPGDQTTITHIYTASAEYSNISLTATNGQCSVVASYPYNVYVFLKQSPLLTVSQPSVCTNGSVGMVISKLTENPYQAAGLAGANYSGYFNLVAQYGDQAPFVGNRTDRGMIPPYYDPYIWTSTYNATLSNFQVGENKLRFIMTSYGFGCQDTTNFAPLLIKGATGGFEIKSDHLCYQFPVILQDTSSTTGNNPILSWQWNFGDGQTSTARKGGIVTHNYDNPGSYLVSMQITDAAGCSPNSPYAQTVTVNGPKASFYASGTDVHLNTTVAFYNTTNDYGNTNTTYSWNFGDGGTSTDPSPVHDYPIPGTYTVTMTATNPSVPCSSVATPVTIIVRNFNSAFGFFSSYIAGGCPPLLVNFTNTSYGYESVDWDFGDGFTADNLNYASHIYTSPGRYIVTLHVHGYNGLEGQFIDSILIYDPVVTLGPLPPETCIGDPVQLSSTAQNTSAFMWDFGDGSIVASSNGIAMHQYLTAGSYKATLLTQNASGCTTDTSLSSLVKVRPDPVITFNPSGPVILCKDATVNLEAGGGLIYKWAPVTGLSNPAVYNPVASPVATTDYTVTVKDDIGCTSKAPLTVQVIPPGDLQVSKDDTVCKGESVKLGASGETLYQWIDEITGLSDTSVNNPVALAPVTTTYTVRGSDAYYCFVNQKSVTVTVRPLPTVNAGADVLVEAGYSATLDAIGSGDVVSYNWQPARYLSCNNCSSPVSTPLATTSYTVNVKNQYGCKASDTVAVVVDCQESHVRIPNAFTPGVGANDVFIVKGISMIKHMAIFDRWGDKVYEKDNFISGDRSSCWDGTSKGRPCPTGAYVYFVEMECPAGGVFSRKGSFVLIR
jgi:gliding motility-associated-like protein